MIRDPDVLMDIRQQWRAVRRYAWASDRSYLLPDGSYVTEVPSEEFYNLPLVLAYSVLDQVLKQLVTEWDVSCSDLGLEAMMLASHNVLPWENYAQVDEGRDGRNDVAHHGQLCSKARCLRYVEAVQAELRAWGILDSF